MNGKALGLVLGLTDGLKQSSWECCVGVKEVCLTGALVYKVCHGVDRVKLPDKALPWHQEAAPWSQTG